MSRFTEAAKEAQEVLQSHAGKNEISDAFNNNSSGVLLQGSDIREKDSSIGMSGVLTVKDLSGNGHCLITRPDLPNSHVEPELLQGAYDYFAKKKLQNAKIMLYLKNSPCRQCSYNLLDWCGKCAQHVAKASCYFVFNFSQYYTEKNCVNGNKRLAWRSADEAKTEYATITDKGGKVKNAKGEYNLINFRNITASDPYGKLNLAPPPTITTAAITAPPLKLNGAWGSGPPKLN